MVREGNRFGLYRITIYLDEPFGSSPKPKILSIPKSETVGEGDSEEDAWLPALIALNRGLQTLLTGSQSGIREYVGNIWRIIEKKIETITL